MNARNRDKCAEFLRSCLLRASPQVASIKLLHLTSESGGVIGSTVLYTCYNDDKNLSVSDALSKMVESVAECVTLDVANYGKTQRYALQAIAEDGGALSLYRFREAPTESGDLAFDETEPANQTGLIAMLMRHTDGAVRQGMAASTALLPLLQKENQELRDRCRELEQQLTNVAMLREAVESKQHERDVELIKLQQQEQHIDKGIRLLSDTLEVVKEKLSAGKTLIPVQEFVKSLELEQLNKIADVLDEKQKESLFGLMSAVAPKLEEKKAPTDKGPNGAQH